jgi:putative peptide maturation dehydrogenase
MLETGGSIAMHDEATTESASRSRELRRCAVLVIEPRETLTLDPRGLLAGESAVTANVRLFALAPHLDEAVEIVAAEVAPLAAIGESIWQTRATLDARYGDDAIARLLACGLLIGDGVTDTAMRERDARIRDTYWSSLPAVAHAFGRWRAEHVGDDARITPHRTLADLVREYGPPPPHVVERAPADARVALPDSSPTDIDALLARRVTCRNFDASRALPLAMFALVLKRVMGAHAEVDVLPGIKALKRSHPSGGALHPLDAYLLVQNVADVPSGLYHYHATAHALESMATHDAPTLRTLASTFVADQGFFADAHVMIVLAARFRRTFWKYRNHPKAYRAIVLEAGHVSQNLYVAATELGLGAFVTAAINEIDIERAFGIDALDEGVLAVCGFGIRADTRATAEFDPLENVWKGEALKRS